MKILVADDDRNIRQGLVDLLEGEGYETIAAADGVEALRLMRRDRPQLVLLDIMMPGMDGYAVCREIRREDETLPVLFISARSEEIDRVLGLELGADDYIQKPFGTREVIARIRAVMRRSLPPQAARMQEQPFVMGDLRILPAELRAERGGQVIELGPRDLRILQLLHRRCGEVVSRDQLLDQCWGRGFVASSRTVDQHVSRLRKLIETDPAQPRIIVTVHGAGYRYDRPAPAAELQR